MEGTPEQALAVTLCPRDPAYLSQPSASQRMAARHQRSSYIIEACLTEYGMESLSKTSVYSPPPQVKLSLLSPCVCSLEVLFK